MNRLQKIAVCLIGVCLASATFADVRITSGDVSVKNETSTPIKVFVDKNGAISYSIGGILIRPGENKKIISSGQKNIRPSVGAFEFCYGTRAYGGGADFDCGNSPQNIKKNCLLPPAAQSKHITVGGTYQSPVINGC